MSKSFNKLTENTKQFRVVEIEENRYVKRTFTKSNNFKDEPLSKEEQEINNSFEDIPF